MKVQKMRELSLHEADVLVYNHMIFLAFYGITPQISIAGIK